MATFDQLAADQRAIIEIVLRQGRSYEQIGEMLDLPPARVRELARDALAELAPFTAEFVDPQWRGQLADYVLGQQTGPEAQATRGPLKRSDPARIWAYSPLDAPDDFYDGGAVQAVAATGSPPPRDLRSCGGASSVASSHSCCSDCSSSGRRRSSAAAATTTTRARAPRRPPTRAPRLRRARAVSSRRRCS